MQLVKVARVTTSILHLKVTDINRTRSLMKFTNFELRYKFIYLYRKL